MKLYKRILLLTLTLCLILPLSACETRDTDGWGTTAPDGEVTTPGEVDDGIIPLEEGLIPLLQDYLRHYNAEYLLGVKYFADKIDDLKNGAQLLRVKFEPSDYYYIGAYSTKDAEHLDREKHFFCCSDEYTWVGYKNETKVREFYNGLPCVAVVQVNQTSVCQDVVSSDADEPDLVHFRLIRRPKFVDGLNASEPVAHEAEFYCIESKTGERSILYYHSEVPRLYDYRMLEYVEIEGQEYIFVPAYRRHSINGVDNAMVDFLKEYEFGEYYDDLMGIMITDLCSEENNAGELLFRGVIKIEDFVEFVNQYREEG